MITSNTMRYCADTFGTTADEETGSITAPFNKQALLISKVAIDCTDKSAVNKIIVSGTQPTGSNRRFIFQVDDKFQYFAKNSSGGYDFVEYPYDGKVTDILKKGNTASGLNNKVTAAELTAAFRGKEVYPVIALEGPSSLDAMPTAKVELETQIANDTLTKSKKSAVYELQDGEVAPIITEITSEVVGDVTVKVRIRNDETWSAYMNLSEAADKTAEAVQFKFTYKVESVGKKAYVKKIVVNYAQATATVSGDNADIYSNVVNFEIPLQTCYVVVRHDPLQNASINAYVNFMTAPKSRRLIQVGTASGARQDFILGVDGVADTDIVASSLEIRAGDKILTDYSYNSETSTITLSAKKGTAIYASYDYKHDNEEWRPMTREYSQPYNDYDGTYMTRYSYILPDAEATNKKIANIRLQLSKKSGSVSNADRGVATGKVQLLTFSHVYKPSSFSFTEEGVDWDYDPDANILSLVAKKGTPLILSGKWTGTAPVIHSFAAGFAVS